MASLFSYQQGTVSAHQPAAQEQQRQPQPDKVENRGGFDCEFVERPPEVLQSECPVCLQIIRDPYQVTCCGYSFCRSCIERIKADNKPCPLCNTKGFSDFPNTGLKRSLYAFKVRCSHQKDGCEWTGELGQLDVHLNNDPPSEKQLDGCPVTTISCEFAHVGCGVKLPRKDMPEHLRVNFLLHMSLLTVSYANLATSHAKQQAQISDLTAEVKSLKENLKASNLLSKEATAQNLRGTIPIARIPLVPSAVLTMTDFQQHKKDGDIWYSPPVYTHHQGYKICFKVSANGSGSGEGTHVSVHVYFRRGEFDDSLKWPFRGGISFQLLDQLKGKDHKTHSLTYDNTVDYKNCSRVVYGERGSNGWGSSKFIAHSRLIPNYLQNDTLQFQVYGGEVHV